MPTTMQLCPRTTGFYFMESAIPWKFKVESTKKAQMFFPPNLIGFESRTYQGPYSTQRKELLLLFFRIAPTELNFLALDALVSRDITKIVSRTFVKNAARVIIAHAQARAKTTAPYLELV
eukprot:08109_5